MKPVATTSETPTWDLESIFAGGSHSTEFENFRAQIKRDLKAMKDKFHDLPSQLNDSSRAGWIDYIKRIQDLRDRIDQAGAFVECLVSQDVHDEKANQIFGETDVFFSELDQIMVIFEAFAKSQEDSQWQMLCEHDEMKEVGFFLNETRDIARLKMAPEYESLVSELAVNGYHAWNRLYDKMYGDLSVDFVEDGRELKLSLGQLANRMSSPDRDIRRRAFEKLEKAWGTRANLASMTLNYLAGFRLTVYEKRNWDSALFEPLLMSRIKRETLEAMWAAVATAGDKLNEFIKAKKAIMGIDKFMWYDQIAPVGSSLKKYTFNEAGEFIIEKLAGFSRKQADFTRHALENRWVEAEDRSGKAGGAFCTGMEHIGQTRVFMTFAGSFDNVGTLAHELGHAYHHYVIKDLPAFARIYPMSLAETASIFNELLVTDAALETAGSKDEKLMLIDQKLQNAHVLFCNIYARFIFERAFYQERVKGIVSRTRLDELMVESQKKAFMGTLDAEGYHPLFWASKLHFYITHTPFYNFPYTFGFLFASGVYNRARSEGPAFAKEYEALLADTGKMTSEEVARKHLGVDLTKPDFWKEAVDRIMADVGPFVKLAHG